MIIREFDPKACESSVVGMKWKKWIVRPYLIDVFKYDHGFRNGFSSVNQNWDSLVDGVVLKKFRCLVVAIFLNVLIAYTLQL